MHVHAPVQNQKLCQWLQVLCYTLISFVIWTILCLWNVFWLNSLCLVDDHTTSSFINIIISHSMLFHPICTCTRNSTDATYEAGTDCPRLSNTIPTINQVDLKCFGEADPVSYVRPVIMIMEGMNSLIHVR